MSNMSLPGAELTLQAVRRSLEGQLARIGVMHRIFGRAKSRPSLERKLQEKSYLTRGAKLQDLLGVRVVVYFPDDCDPVRWAIENTWKIDGHSIDEPDSKTFGPKRLNIVVRLGKDVWQVQTGDMPIDQTCEIQIRTVLSEGWHEVEHDLRYKCRKDWMAAGTEDRVLNGILGSLETAEWSMNAMFDALAFQHYRSSNWEAMLRHKFRLRMSEDSHLSLSVSDVLSNVDGIAKAIWKADRGRLLGRLARSRIELPWTYDNLVYLLEAFEDLGCQQLRKLRPEFVADVLTDGLLTHVVEQQ